MIRNSGNRLGENIMLKQILALAFCFNQNA